ncbi:MAG: EAL domain-containing protein [Gallionella sp.]|nr:EAL domain-containing protein [Gallionella sp.]
MNPGSGCGGGNLVLRDYYWGGLRSRIIIATLLVFMAVLALSLVIFDAAISRVNEQLGGDLARQQATTIRSQMMESISRELALSRQMAGSPLLRRWAEREGDPQLRREALAELESYRQRFASNSWFYALNGSLHYYYNGPDNRYSGGSEIAYTLKPSLQKDQWYFLSLQKVKDYALNVDYDIGVGVFNLWINVPIRRADGSPLGVAGTGIDMSGFIRRFIDQPDSGIENILIDRELAIQAHRDKTLIDRQSIRTRPERSTLHALLGAGESAAVQAAVRRLDGGREESVSLPAHINGQKRMLGIAAMPELGFYVVTLLDTGRAVDHSPLLTLLSAFLLSLLAVAAAIWLLVDRMVLRRLNLLFAATEKMQRGEIIEPMESTVRDELGVFVNAFSRMAQRQQQHTAELERRVSERTVQLEQMAHYDMLTGLPNRALLADRMGQALAQCRRDHKRLAVCYIDLDGFKPVNDTAGHDVGDKVLIEITARLKQMLRGGDTVARIGGDEFVLLLMGQNTHAECQGTLERLLTAMSSPITVGERSFTLSASIGVTFYPDDDVDADTLLRHADHTMYIAKQSGKNCYHFFDPENDQRTRSYQTALVLIRHGLNHGEFELFYQPKVDMKSKRLVGAEALIRWRHPERGLLAPAEFLHIVEGTEVEVEMGEWVIATALQQLKAWHEQGVHLELSVNISAHHLQSPRFVERLKEMLLAHPELPHGSLQIEVLETTALQDVAKIAKVIETCHQVGVGFALDDFGTGYSSLSYLSNLPVDTLKIDQSFVRDMMDDKGDHAIVQGVIALAKAFERRTVAEGVETDQHYQALLDVNCEIAQGYGIGRPMPADEFDAWVVKRG